MEEHSNMKYSCKLCNKFFVCGRSLGGHMRSHVINSIPFDPEKLDKNKLFSTLNHGGTNATIETGYKLRENPKKSSKFTEFTEDTSLNYRVCKECGKSFQSWKALFGHMKCHSVKFSHSVQEEVSWTSTNHRKMNMYSESGNEFECSSGRKIKRYMAKTTSSSSLLIHTDSAFEIDQEQEDVAINLMMLSRDMGLNSIVESIDNNSEFLSVRNDVLISDFEGINSESKTLKQNQKYEFRIGKKLNSNQGQDGETGLRIFNPNKRKGLQLFDPFTCGMFDKKSKFQCTTCNKTFHSYQALGGHRASHKKLKGCYASKSNGDGNDNNTDNQITSNPSDDQETRVSSKKIKSHECPVCFKVFSSGQALGGHKRSHLIGVMVNDDNKDKQIEIEIVKANKESRDFLDLNRPAPIEENCSTTTISISGGVGFKPWWDGSNHRHETLVGLLSQ